MSEHPIISALTNGIVREIHEIRKARHVRAALILTYCGIDQVSYLANELIDGASVRSRFTAWIERYMFPPGTAPMAALDVYAARCAMVHAYGAPSKLHDEGRVTKQLAFMPGFERPYGISASHPNIVVIDFDFFIDSFITAVTNFCKEMEGAPVEIQGEFNERLHKMFNSFDALIPA